MTIPKVTVGTRGPSKAWHVIRPTGQTLCGAFNPSSTSAEFAVDVPLFEAIDLGMLPCGRCCRLAKLAVEEVQSQ